MDGIMSVPCEFKVDNFTTDIAKVTLKVYHNGLNLNNSFFDDDCFENSKESFKNKPIVGNIIYEEDGTKHWGGHNLEESPQGVIIESNNYHVEFDEDMDRTYVIVDGVIFKDYCPDAYELLKQQDQTDVSMEVLPIDYYKDDDGILHIKQFRLLCVTIIDSNPAMEGANIKMFSTVTDKQLESFAEKFSVMIEKANKLVEGGKLMGREEVISKFSYLEGNEKYTEIIENEEMSVEDLEKALFELSASQKEFAIREVLSQYTVVKTDWEGYTYEMNKYNLQDVVGDIVIIYATEDHKTYGVPFNMVGDKATLNLDDKKRYVRGDWREYQEGDSEPIDMIKLSEDKIKEVANDYIEKLKSSFVATETEEYKELKEQFDTLTTEKESLASEIEELRQFKAEKDLEVRVKAENELFSQYDEELGEIESYQELKEHKSEFSIEELETKCLIEYGKFMKSNKKSKESFSAHNEGGYTLDGKKEQQESVNSAWNLFDTIK